MDFYDEHPYAEPLSRIEAMYFDTGFVPRKYAELDLQNIQVISSGHEGDDFHVTCRFEMAPSLPLPGFVKKALGQDTIAVEQTDRWNTATNRGVLEIKLLSLSSVHIHCDMHLDTDGDTCVNRMQWRVTCSLPLVGGKLASFLAKDIQAKSAADLEASLRVMEQHY